MNFYPGLATGYVNLNKSFYFAFSSIQPGEWTELFLRFPFSMQADSLPAEPQGSTSRLLPNFGSYEKSCCKCPCAGMQVFRQT